MADSVTNYVAKIEAVSGVLRVYAEDESTDQDEYLFAATVVWKDSKTIELKGVTSAGLPMIDGIKALREEARRMGVETICWERRRPGKPSKTVTIKVR